jgi:hypothetical protein
MVLAQMVVDSVVREGRSVRATAQLYGVSKPGSPSSDCDVAEFLGQMNPQRLLRPRAW